MQTINVTLDTNVLDSTTIARMKQAAQDLPVIFINVTVTGRELEGTDIQLLPNPILETAVWGESRWGQAVWGGDKEADLFEKLLETVSNRSFPKPSKRGNLTNGQKRQMRDVMILIAHTREGRDILVTSEKKAFIGKGGVLKKKIEMLCSTRIMNVDEFCSFCKSLK